MSSDGSLYVYALIAGITSLVSGIKNHRTYRIIENHPTSKASSAPQGLCELQGFAWPKVPGFKNYDGCELIYYGFQIQKYVTRGSGKNKRSYWEAQYSRVIQVPFYLVDATGLVEIQVSPEAIHQNGEAKTGFAALLQGLFKWSPAANEGFTASPRIRNWESLSKAEKDYLLSTVIQGPPAGFPPSDGFLGLVSGNYRIVESSVKVGSPLYAKGYFLTQSQENTTDRLLGLTEFSKHVFEKASRTLKKMDYLLDKNHDGKISEQEVREGYTGFAEQIRKKAVVVNNIDAEIPIRVFGKIGSSQDFDLLLFTLHQSQIVTKLKRKFYLATALGTILLTLAVGDVARIVYPAIKEHQYREARLKEKAIEEERQAQAAKVAAVENLNKMNSDQNNVQKVGASAQNANSSEGEHVGLTPSEVKNLHHNCVNRMLESSCRKLLGQADQLRLPASYRQYYHSVLCKLGKSENCP